MTSDPVPINGVPEPTCWPDRLQELLLRATIHSGDSARRAWAEWVADADFDTLDEGSNRLLPETYTNLIANGIDHELLGRMKGLKRRAWLQNQLLFHQAGAAIRMLEDRGIETMVTKGAALVLRHYLDHGRRPMADFDIVVKRSRAREAVETLFENRFKFEEASFEERDFDLGHAATCRNDRGRQFDLHWQVITGCSDGRLRWENAVPVALKDTETLVPSPTVLLLNVCVHGLRANEIPPLRWVVDAAMILRNSEIDWDLLLELSRRFKFAHRMRVAMQYLGQFELNIPDRVVGATSERDPFGLQRIEFEHLTGKRETSSATQVALVWLRFNRHLDQDSKRSRLAQFPSYLKLIWGTTSVWRLPFVAMYKVARRLFVNPR